MSKTIDDRTIADKNIADRKKEQIKDFDRIANKFLFAAQVMAKAAQVGGLDSDDTCHTPGDFAQDVLQVLEDLQHIESQIGYEIFDIRLLNEPKKINDRERATGNTDPLDLTERINTNRAKSDPKRVGYRLTDRAQSILRDVESAIPF